MDQDKYDLKPGYHSAGMWLAWAVRKYIITEEDAITIFNNNFLLKHVDK